MAASPARSSSRAKIDILIAMRSLTITIALLATLAVSAAPLKITNGTGTRFEFTLTGVKPKKAAQKFSVDTGETVQREVTSTTRTKHKIEVRDRDGKRLACSVFSNASEIEFTQTPDQRYHFICTAASTAKRTVGCALSACR